MTDFAKALLMKYGWTEGKGLGKNECGITEALRPKLKFDTAGVGHRDTDWNEWWETAFNKAANNIVVESHNQGVSISVSKQSTSNGLSKKKLNKQQSKYASSYGNFLKISTLRNGNLIRENNSNVMEVEKDEKDRTFTSLTDKELFKVCGGRTAHKGARHGLTLSGKLKRIAQQEKNLLGISTSVDTEKLEKRINNFQEDAYDVNSNKDRMLPLPIEEPSIPEVSKSTRKKKRQQINNFSDQLNIPCNVEDGDKKHKHRSRKTISMKESKEKRGRGKKESFMDTDSGAVEKAEADKEIDDTTLPVCQKLGKEITLKKSDAFTLKKEKKKSRKMRKLLCEQNILPL